VSDAVIVLANLMSADGVPNGESLARLSLACRLVKSGEAPLLVTCGWAYRDDSEIPIAIALAQFAVANLGLYSSQILVETNSRDTVGDAVFTKRNFANRLGWNEITVVTSDYHAARTREIFSFVYGKPIDVRSVACPEGSERDTSERASLEAFRKTFLNIKSGDDIGIYQRLRTNHPFYNGHQFPILIDRITGD
jgi:hypothetical protein